MPRRLEISAEHTRSVVERHAAFWKRDAGVLRYTGVYSQSSPVSLPTADGGVITDAESIEPKMVQPDELINIIEQYDDDRLDAHLALKGEYLVNVGQGDFLPLAMPLMKFPWLEAILGCRIEMTVGQIWDKEYTGDPEDIASDTSSFDHNPWFELYVEFIKRLQERLSGRFFVSTSSNQRGVSDLVAAVMGVQAALIGWIDSPRFMSRILRRCTDAVLALGEATNAVVEPALGGYACKWGLWCPDKVVATQADHASLVSPDVYAAQILPYDREVFRSSPLSIIHLHNNGLHHAPALMNLPDLDAIQVWMDPYPASDRRRFEVDMLQRIADRKPLIVDVYQSDLDESDWLLGQLTGRAVFYKNWVDPEVYDGLPDDHPGTDRWLRAGP